MEKIFNTPIQEIIEFNRIGYHYTRVCEKNGFYLFKMERKGQAYPQYEIWKGKKYTQPDGTVIMTKPSSNDFGTYGWYLCGSTILSGLKKLKDKFSDFPYEEFKAHMF